MRVEKLRKDGCIEMKICKHENGSLQEIVECTTEHTFQKEKYIESYNDTNGSIIGLYFICNDCHIKTKIYRNGKYPKYIKNYMAQLQNKGGLNK